MSRKQKKGGRQGRPSTYSPEFRRDAVKMVLDEDRPIADVARSIGVNPGTPLGTGSARSTSSPSYGRLLYRVDYPGAAGFVTYTYDEMGRSKTLADWNAKTSRLYRNERVFRSIYRRREVSAEMRCYVMTKPRYMRECQINGVTGLA